MSFEIQQFLRPAALAAPAIPGPKDAGFARAFADVLTAEDLVDAAAVARARRAAEAASERLDFVLVKLGLISESDLCIAYATYCKLPVVGGSDIPGQAVLADRLRLPFLKANRLLPISFDGRCLLIATADPFVDEAAKAISYMLEVQVELAVIAPAEIERALRKLYQDPGTESHADVGEDTASPIDAGSEYDIERLRDIANEAPVIRLVNQIISRAVERGASDVHIEPGRDAVAIRYRIDGFLQQDRIVPASLRAALTTRVKIMAKLDIAERRLPHDGRIKTAVRGVEIDIRVSTLPTVFGESIVMRILDRTRVELDFTKLGLDAETQEKLHRLMALPNGIVLVTGPTGSGKTTTLYTALKNLNRPELKLFTVEDPIEYQLSGINQIQVQPQIGLDFPKALRSILRQDPDIVMIGEIRDLETARIAIQAALTGHLVFSTLHTNGAIAAITRLIDIGLERYLLASTVSGVMAQRLVRKLCPACSRPHTESERLHGSLKLAASSAAVDLSNSREQVGCEACNGTGYRGRTTICELLIVDDGIREAIGRRSQDQRLIEQLARTSGFRTLYEDGLFKVGAGETTLEEVLRVTRAS
ncbi:MULTISPECIES: GspE/PulE family protein [Bradyrhizobium]|uniref:Type II secretion system protein E (GspE) n=2 Tax=Bradyrhizobium TaxID=374 RepID=A0ABY0Q6L5_9BRAD|nr:MULTISPECIES: ATPase, T2SS/T4P/T4SS family [Bradyrhizobium]SDJ60196.1 type II secretion system protein E (GspE) [Bradyrhizobium ottawaense]SEC37875.1 type II secretion system protein E (GspE) [Bradyrhizobium lablabi]